MGDLFGIEETNGMYTLLAMLSAALHRLHRASPASAELIEILKLTVDQVDS